MSDEDEPIYCTHCGTDQDEVCGETCAARQFYTSGAHERLGDLEENGPFCHWCGQYCGGGGDDTSACHECAERFPR